MEIEIWSDVMCPFCYIGKRHFEKALEQFAEKDSVRVTWKSYQLDPALKPEGEQNIYDYLAERKGISRQQSETMHERVVRMAEAAGLHYDFDKAIVANSFDAHRLSHLAAKHGLQDAMEERLFAAYFTEGKNIGDPETLVQLGAEVGLDENEIRGMLRSDAFSAGVKQDADEAAQLGARGVPFFVIDRKYGISGAQPVETFLRALDEAAKTGR
ncbi:MAG TPA: DsbA family oxidoreductase [Bacteroidia bacterium]|nr:DsbA family oxidoreductase [Bacteroidia bacterium]